LSTLVIHSAVGISSTRSPKSASIAYGIAPLETISQTHQDTLLPTNSIGDNDQCSDISIPLVLPHLWISRIYLQGTSTGGGHISSSTPLPKIPAWVKRRPWGTTPRQTNWRLHSPRICKNYEMDCVTSYKCKTKFFTSLVLIFEKKYKRSESRHSDLSIPPVLPHLQIPRIYLQGNIYQRRSYLFIHALPKISASVKRNPRGMTLRQPNRRRHSLRICKKNEMDSQAM